MLDDNLYRLLIVVIKLDEVFNLYISNKYIFKDEIIYVMREKVCIVLIDDFNLFFFCIR